MVFDSWRDQMVMYDGWTRLYGPMGGWNTAVVTNPPYRSDHAMAFDSERGVTVLFGGVAFNGPLQADTWEWDGTSWTLRASAGPSPRKFHAMAYDEVLKKTILFGGEGAAGDLGDTWAWDGTTWDEMAIAGPSARSGHRMAYDSNRDRIVLFGGPLGSTWEFASSCPSGFNNRFLTISSEGIHQATALRVTLTSLHHPDPANGGAPDFSAFEGQVRWAGPTVLEVESSTNPAVVYASFLQCSPHYQLWTPARLLQLTGSAIVPSSKYQVEWLAASCMGQESTCTDILRTSSFITTRWGDVIPPFRPPSPTVQPDISDVSALVDKFRSFPGAPVKAQTLLAGTPPFGHVNIAVDVDFAQVSACVDAFRGMAYPYSIQACP
jgi:hypothetical protein